MNVIYRHKLRFFSYLILLFLSQFAQAEWFLRGTYNNWGTQAMYSNEENVYRVDDISFLENGYLKFDRWGDWLENYGEGGLFGENIAIAAGTYDIVFFADSKNWSFIAESYHFRGTPNAWQEGKLLEISKDTPHIVETCQFFSDDAPRPRFKIDPNGQWQDSFPAEDINVQAGWVHISVDTFTQEISVQENLGENCEELTTADTPQLKSWWHGNNLETREPLTDKLTVRRSTEFDLRIASGEDKLTPYLSFDYMSLPRNGLDAESVADNYGCTSAENDHFCKDGAGYSAKENMSMSWTSFLYGSSGAYLTIKTVHYSGIEDVTIRPTTLKSIIAKRHVSDTEVELFIPYRASGFRFSVEFANDLMTHYVDYSEFSYGSLTSDGQNGALPAIHQEPRNALLVFAEALDSQGDVPDITNKQNVQQISPGLINPNTFEKEILYFGPGEYSMGSEAHAYLAANTRWVYLAPGAYVKGAFEFRGEQSDYRVSGLGIISGEEYSYEPDKNNSYHRRDRSTSDCHDSCVKMLQFYSSDTQQELVVEGVTIANPPYHSFVVYGNEDTFTTDFARNKQVGAWYWQTDGVELYDGGSMSHAFFHANDDVLKVYHSGITINDIVVWKAENGPVVQFGWAPRTVSNAKVSNINVIHNRMYWIDTHNHCLINSARSYSDIYGTEVGDNDHLIQNLKIENIRSEGLNLCTMRLFVLEQWDSVYLKNIYIEAWNELDFSAQESTFSRAVDKNTGVAMEIGYSDVLESGHQGLSIHNYCVGNEAISKADSNWSSQESGRLNFDAELWSYWDAYYDPGYQCESN